MRLTAHNRRQVGWLYRMNPRKDVRRLELSIRSAHGVCFFNEHRNFYQLEGAILFGANKDIWVIQKRVSFRLLELL